MTLRRKVQLAVLSFIPVLLIVATYLLVSIDVTQEVEIVAEPEVIAVPEFFASKRVIGYSVEEREIEAFVFGRGENRLLFVGGMHGGYEWNSALLAYGMIEHFQQNPELIPENTTVSIIPSLNPDGLYKVTGTTGVFSITDVQDPSVRVSEGRFNAHEVDLNRNFDCKWESESTWRGNVVSAGTEAFSEPEAAALRDYVTEFTPSAVVLWHSKANNVYASECLDGVLPDTMVLMNTYADAGSYGKVESFDAYPITGDAEGWLASIGVPAVTVELESARSIEWERNFSGVSALLKLYSLVK